LIKEPNELEETKKEVPAEKKQIQPKLQPALKRFVSRLILHFTTFLSLFSAFSKKNTDNKPRPKKTVRLPKGIKEPSIEDTRRKRLLDNVFSVLFGITLLYAIFFSL
jgi:cell division septal protein FtsQ